MIWYLICITNSISIPNAQSGRHGKGVNCKYQFQIRWVTFGARKCHSVPDQVGIGTRCELRVRELGTPSSSTESYCHRRPDLHSCPHFADLEIGVLRDYIVHEDAEKRRVMNLAGYYLHLGQGKWQPGQESSRQSHKSRPECSKTPWDIFHLRKHKFDAHLVIFTFLSFF